MTPHIVLFLIHAFSISGNEEGGFGWIAFNYLKKIIGPKKVPCILFKKISVSNNVG